ncbi:hypothetical protein ACFL9T_10900 [Thermodesulfobacteriota bacterium]
MAGREFPALTGTEGPPETLIKVALAETTDMPYIISTNKVIDNSKFGFLIISFSPFFRIFSFIPNRTQISVG